MDPAKAFSKAVILLVWAAVLVSEASLGLSAADIGDVITTDSTYPQINPDGTISTMRTVVIKKADGTTVVNTERLPIQSTGFSQSQVRPNTSIDNPKLGFIDASAVQPDEPLTIEALLARRHPPLSVAKGPKLSIYRWADAEVTVREGVVIKWTPRDREAERAEAADRGTRAYAENERRLQQQQTYVPSAASAASTTPTPASSEYIPRAVPSKDEQIAQIKWEIEQCRRVIDLHFKEGSTPFHLRRVSPAQLELAEASLARLEKELEELDRP